MLLLPEDKTLDQDSCTLLVTQYLEGQGWRLVDPVELAEEIWPGLARQALQGDAAVKAVQTAVWQRYGEMLYRCCRQPDQGQYDRAWLELKVWLGRQAPRLVAHPQEQEDVVQETLVELQKRLGEDPMRAPRAFFAYASQMVLNKRTDKHRKETAVKRGGDSVLSLEAIQSETGWEEILLPPTGVYRGLEETVTDQETRQKLQEIFRQNLPTELQIQVAEMHFLDGLEPVEIAALMGKRPHEVRLVKARIVQSLRNLPAEARQELLAILEKEDQENLNAE